MLANSHPTAKSPPQTRAVSLPSQSTWGKRFQKDRKGLEGFDVPHGHVLCARIKQHADSIASATNLELHDFKCRWLVVDEVFIPLAESLLISHFKPLWNVAVDGFGNHDPGAGRVTGRKSPWDVLHPGRTWAERLQPGCTYEDIIARIRSHIETFPIPPVRAY